MVYPGASNAVLSRKCVRRSRYRFYAVYAFVWHRYSTPLLQTLFYFLRNISVLVDNLSVLISTD